MQDKSDSSPIAERIEETPENYFHWLKEAEAIVAANYSNGDQHKENSLVVQIANGLMFQNKLSEIALALDDIARETSAIAEKK